VSFYGKDDSLKEYKKVINNENISNNNNNSNDNDVKSNIDNTNNEIFSKKEEILIIVIIILIILINFQLYNQILYIGLINIIQNQKKIIKIIFFQKKIYLKI
jgi:hypothetical protein